MSAHAIWIKFTIKEGCMDEFMEASMYDAKHSMEDEPACQHFRVMTKEDEPNTVYFLEVYDNKEGHATHRTYPHYKVFADVAERVVEDRERTELVIHNPQDNR